MEIELRQLLQYARRWWWLIIILPVLAGGIAYRVADSQRPIYAATATLLINPSPSLGGEDINSVTVGQRLAVTYQQLVVTEPVLGAVARQLQLPYDFETLEDKVTASTTRDTQLLRISVSDPSPAAAAAIANAVAEEFARFISSQAAATANPSRVALQDLIDNTQAELDEVRAQIQGAEAADEDTRVETLQVRATQLEQSLAGLLQQAQEMDLSSAVAQSQMSVVIPARAPKTPFAPRVLFYTALAAFMGLIAAVGAVGLVEYLDNTAKSGTDFAQLLGVPLLSTVFRLTNVQRGSSQLYMETQAKSNSAEAIRLLRANLAFAASASEITSLGITSAGPGEGKSTVAANLAIATAQAGLNTVLIDADLRRPTQHRIWNIANAYGLTTLLMRPDQAWTWAANTGVRPNMAIILSGPIPPNPAELLSSARFQSLIKEISESADIVIIDTPPILAVSDALAVASDVDGVVVVARASGTRIDSLRQAVGMLSQRSVRVLGVVLNQESRRGASDYYYSGYYGDGESSAPKAAPVATDGQAPRRRGAFGKKASGVG